MDDTPYLNDGADASLRKTVSLLNKIEANTSSASSVADSVGEKLKKTAIPADIIALG